MNNPLFRLAWLWDRLVALFGLLIVGVAFVGAHVVLAFCEIFDLEI